MKKLLLVFAVFAVAFSTNAQIETPQPSPFSKVEQKVGLTDITIEYSRPGVKGRKIFGGLEPWGTIWRTGANKNTTISFSDDVNIDGQSVKAGTYAIFTRLNSAKQWEVMFYSDTENWGTPQNWDDSKVVALAKVEVMEVPFSVETFTIDINNITNNGGTIDMIWEKSYVGIPFTVPTDKITSANIDRIMSGPSIADYYKAAVYYKESGKDISLASKWIDTAVGLSEKDPKFWMVHQQALIHAKAGNKDKAVAAAKTSLALAKEAKNDAYVKKNEEALKEWGAM